MAVRGRMSMRVNFLAYMAIIALFVIMDIQNDTDCRVHNSLLILKDKQKNIIIFFFVRWLTPWPSVHCYFYSTILILLHSDFNVISDWMPQCNLLPLNTIESVKLRQVTHKHITESRSMNHWKCFIWALSAVE